MHKYLLIFLAAGLTACPTPSEDRTHVPPPNGAGPSGQHVGGEANPGPHVEEGEPPPSDGEQGPLTGHVSDYGSGDRPLDEDGEGDLRLIDPTHSQQDIAGAPHYEISGVVRGSCRGDLRIDVLSTRPISGDAGATGPLTALDLDSVGEFSVLIPEGDTVEIAAVCDENGDGVIRGGDSLSAPSDSDAIGSAQSNVELRLEIMDTVLDPQSGGLTSD